MRNADRLEDWSFGLMTLKFGPVVGGALAESGATWRRALLQQTH